jgi:hypothetical protein
MIRKITDESRRIIIRKIAELCQMSYEEDGDILDVFLDESETRSQLVIEILVKDQVLKLVIPHEAVEEFGDIDD